MTLTDKEITAISLKFFGVHNFARAIEARVLEELRKQEPLTETQIREMWERTFSTNNPFCPCDLRSFTKAVRATEGAIQTAKPIPPRIKDLSELRDELDAAPIPPDEPKLKRASLMAFGVISEIRKLVGNGKVQFVADLGGSIWTWPDAADSAITELRSVCFDAAPIQPTPSQQEALDSLAGLLLGIELPKGKALAARQERACCLRDFILARPDTEGSGK